jgi:hypothetical protein
MTKCGGRSFAEEGLGGMSGEEVEGSRVYKRKRMENGFRMEIGERDDSIEVYLIVHITFNVNFKNLRWKNSNCLHYSKTLTPRPDKIKTVGY